MMAKKERESFQFLVASFLRQAAAQLCSKKEKKEKSFQQYINIYIYIYISREAGEWRRKCQKPIKLLSVRHVTSSPKPYLEHFNLNSHFSSYEMEKKPPGFCEP